LLQTTLLVSVIGTLLLAFTAHAQHRYTQLDYGIILPVSVSLSAPFQWT